MEIPVLNRMSDFESGINSLQSQSLLSLSGVEGISKAYSFWKWGALILAILASFSAIIKRIKVLIVKFKNDTASLQEPLLRVLDDDDSSGDTCSQSSSSSDYYEEDDEDENDDRELIRGSPAEDGRPRTDEIFQVKGCAGFNFLESPWLSRSSSGLRRRRSIGDHFSEFASGKSVVKLWDNLGLGFGFELDGDDSSISWNADQSSPPSSSASPRALIVSKPSAAGLGFWDSRAGGMRPAILAEWGPHVGNAYTVGRGGVRKLYLSGGGKLAAVGDLRKVNTLLDNVTEADVETWWDADAVVVNDELVGGGSVRNGPGSAVTRCCDAVRSYLFF
ncbi:hypothetical protein CDL15_Pgr017557 [Punica granatum]|uniref:Uncharacterized protein n=1 Tax=Punica granatum TaxID=22663 RepID=A0A218W653_PUNGR|nr:hypothetical protein CDL15_Pgr017557 [Punica granatum]